MSITLYEAPMSSAIPVLHTLIELDVEYERVTFDLAAKDQKKPEFLKMNPHGKVPALVNDGTPMFEALAIMLWLGEHFGVDKKLWPAATAPERMTAMAWATWAYVSYGSAVYRYRLASRGNGSTQTRYATLAEEAQHELSTMLGALEDQLLARDYVLGDNYSLADIIVGDVITWGTYEGVAVADFPRIRAWLKRVHARPSYVEAWGVSE